MIPQLLRREHFVRFDSQQLDQAAEPFAGERGTLAGDALGHGPKVVFGGGNGDGVFGTGTAIATRTQLPDNEPETVELCRFNPLRARRRPAPRIH